MVRKKISAALGSVIFVYVLVAFASFFIRVVKSDGLAVMGIEYYLLATLAVLISNLVFFIASRVKLRKNKFNAMKKFTVYSCFCLVFLAILSIVFSNMVVGGHAGHDLDYFNLTLSGYQFRGIIVVLFGIIMAVMYSKTLDNYSSRLNKKDPLMMISIVVMAVISCLLGSVFFGFLVLTLGFKLFYSYSLNRKPQHLFSGIFAVLLLALAGYIMALNYPPTFKDYGSVVSAVSIVLVLLFMLIYIIIYGINGKSNKLVPKCKLLCANQPVETNDKNLRNSNSSKFNKHTQQNNNQFQYAPVYAKENDQQAQKYDFTAMLSDLANLKNANLISDEVFNEKKKEILEGKFNV